MKVKAIFPAKISYWIFIPIFGLFFYFLFHGFMKEKWLPVAIMLVTIIAVGNLTFFTRYIITLNDELFIQIGWFGGYKILISDIISIEKTMVAISSPAPSLDRIQINYGKYSSIIISPKDKIAFIKFLKGINPAITLKAPLSINFQN